MKISIYTPENPLLVEQEIKEAVVPSVKGEIGILPGHAALVSLLEAGVLRYLPQNSTTWEKVAIGWGYLEVAGESIKILAESAGTKKLLDLNQVKKELNEVKKKLEKIDLEPSERQQLEREKKKLQGEADV